MHRFIIINIITHNADAIAVSNSFYGKSHRKLHYNWVECTGIETNITQCSHGIVDNDNSEKCAHVAGVICRSRNPQTNGIIHKIIYAYHISPMTCAYMTVSYMSDVSFLYNYRFMCFSDLR